MMKKALAAMALAGITMSAQAGVLYQQGFDNVNGLASQGWVMNNASSPNGITGWYQGDQSQFGAQAGAGNSYIAANYNNAAAGGTLANWLISPVFDISKDGSVSFWLRAAADPDYSDHVAFGFSSGGSALADFIMSTSVTVPTDGWSLYTIAYDGRGAGSTARFAIEYTGAAVSANYIGIDSFSVNVPEPASALLFAAGALGLRVVRRRQRG